MVQAEYRAGDRPVLTGVLTELECALAVSTKRASGIGVHPCLMKMCLQAIVLHQ